MKIRNRSLLAGAVTWVILSLFETVQPAWSGAAAPLAFEDRNNNGQFDGSDQDITAFLYELKKFETTESVVFTGGALRAPDPGCRKSGLMYCGGFEIKAGKKITVGTSLLATIYGGQVILEADEIVIGNDIKIDGRDVVYLLAAHTITIGNNVTLQSLGGSANHGIVKIRSDRGDITIGNDLEVTSRDRFEAIAWQGDLFIDVGSDVYGRIGIDMYGELGLTMDGSKLRSNLNVSLEAGNGPLSLRDSAVKVPKAMETILRSGQSVDITGSIFSKPPQIDAPVIIGN